MNYQIPEEEMENFISVYWQMLGVIESNTDQNKDILDKHLVEGAYRVLARAGVIDKKPRWMKKANQ